MGKKKCEKELGEKVSMEEKACVFHQIIPFIDINRVNSR